MTPHDPIVTCSAPAADSRVPSRARRTTAALAPAGIIPLAAAWGASFLFIRIAVPALGALGVAEARALLGGAALVVLMAATGRRLAFQQGLWRYVMLGALASAAPYVLMCYATQAQGAALTAIFFATVPMFSLVVESVWFRRRPSLVMAAALATGLAGVTLIVGGDSAGLSAHAVGAYAAALGAAIFSALGGNYSHRHFAAEDPATQAVGQSVTAAVLMIPIVIAAPPRHLPSLEQWGALAGLAVACTAMAYTLFFWLVARLGPTRALTTEILVPAFAAVWSWLALGERLPPTSLAGGAAILAGSAVAMDWRPPWPPWLLRRDVRASSRAGS